MINVDAIKLFSEDSNILSSAFSLLRNILFLGRPRPAEH